MGYQKKELPGAKKGVSRKMNRLPKQDDAEAHAPANVVRAAKKRSGRRSQT